ncbi:MAG TPA: hypothetical protein VFM46_15915 [Pseudomonadales bacterium]|nr:hypothetical protein [Pseudomonadales bacterium]
MSEDQQELDIDVIDALQEQLEESLSPEQRDLFDEITRLRLMQLIEAQAKIDVLEDEILDLLDELREYKVQERVDEMLEEDEEEYEEDEE